MSSVWTSHANHLADFLNDNKHTEAHMYLEQMMLFPVDIQDQIIDEISHLANCNSDDIAQIITQHSMIEMK